ncbi:ATP-binding protein [Salinimicrobium sp. GXAS 041]|uniref:ATP-binding protein n=1 Tax=Salinimicrobium sp. GXAS 041 TaxID=3400806 RepID=UPI003C721C30
MAFSRSNSYPEEVNIDNCAREPIHIIGKCQSHGAVVACNLQDLTVLQCSENTAVHFSIPHNELLGKEIAVLIGKELQKEFKQHLCSEQEFFPVEVVINEKKFLLLPHFSEEILLLDFEPLEEKQEPVSFQKQLSSILNRLKNAKSTQDLCERAASLTKDIFEYDRVMIYRFDEAWNGEVVAEEKAENATSWLGLHYPATDIPAQSRALFLENRMRIITNVYDEPVPVTPVLSPLTQQPLDLSQSALRGVSPIHLEYLQNMGVGASLTAAIVVKGKLWGLLTCHHNTAIFINYYQRESCRLLVEIFSNELSLKETNNFLEERRLAEKIKERLVLQMNAEKDLFEALTENTLFTDLVPCIGGALLFNGVLQTAGTTPSKNDINSLVSNFLAEKEENLFTSSKLSEEFEPAEKYKEIASGILSLRISENNYLLWFKPEVIQTVSWGGDPNKKGTYDEEKQRISPRKSFEKWSEQVRGVSEKWKEADVNVVKAFGENISYLLLEKQRNEIKGLNERLQEANRELELFNFGLSHDLRAPLRGMKGYLSILMEDHAEKLGDSGLTTLETSIGLAREMNSLIDDILAYSRTSSDEVRKGKIDVNALLEEILKTFNPEATFPKTKIVVAKNLPEMEGDKRMLFQLWANLIGNALTYSAKIEEPKVEIGYIGETEKNVYFVRDNGIGIPKEQQEKIFATFSRLKGKEYKGSGIGLALVKLVVEKHEGRIWVESEEGKGATFFFEM